MMKTKGVRIGPASLVTLIAVLLLAVLALLCVTSANAQSVMANREADSLSETYSVDSYGQCLVANIDEELHSNSPSIDAVYHNLSSLEENAAIQSKETNLSVSATLSNNAIQLSVAAPNGRTLNAAISEKAGAVSVDSWKLTTSSQQTNDDTLWSGETSK